MHELSAAGLEALLGDCRVRNLRLDFEIAHPDGQTTSVRMTVPEGELARSGAWEHPYLPSDYSVTLMSAGRWVETLKLMPKPTSDVEKAARWEWEAE